MGKRGARGSGYGDFWFTCAKGCPTLKSYRTWTAADAAGRLHRERAGPEHVTTADGPVRPPMAGGGIR